MQTPDYSQVLWDNGRPYYATQGGGKLYIPPAAAMSMFDDPQALAWAKQQGYEIKGGREGLNQPLQTGTDGKVIIPPNPVTMGDQGGGLWQTTGVWNGDTGQFDHNFDWGNAFTMLVAAGMTAGAASAFLAGGGAAAGGAGAGGVGLGETAATTGLATGAGLGGTTATIAAPTLASTAGATGIGSLAAGGAGTGAEIGATTGVPALASTSTAGLGTLPNVAASGGVPAASTAGGTGALATANNIAGNPLVQMGVGAIGDYLKSKGQSEESAAGRISNANLAAINLGNSQSQQDRTNAQNAATPLGESQNFVAKNALLAALLPNMRNINSGVGQRPGAGGFLPDGGLNPQLINSLYGTDPTLESLSQRAKQISAINPSAPQEDFSKYGGFTSGQTDPYQTSVQGYQADQQKKQDAQRAAMQQYINASLQDKPGPLQNAIIGTGGTANYNNPQAATTPAASSPLFPTFAPRGPQRG